MTFAYINFAASEHPRGADGQFVPKKGSAPDVGLGDFDEDDDDYTSLWSSQPVMNYRNAIDEIHARHKAEIRDAQEKILIPALAEVVRSSFPEATAVSYTYEPPFYEDRGYYSLGTVWKGDEEIHGTPLNDEFRDDIHSILNCLTPDEAEGETFTAQF